MILGYESALSVKSEEMCRARYFKLNHMIFLLNTPQTTHKTQQTVKGQILESSLWGGESISWKEQNVSIEKK